MQVNQGTLYIVGTPIGNLDDMTKRAIDVLSAVDLIAAEDTRRAQQLLQCLGIRGKEIISYYDEVEQKKAPKIIDRIKEANISVALISDAGTPCISDPGFRLVALARERNIPVSPIPGPSAVTALISSAGLPCDRFMFVGFLPTKESALIDEFKSWAFLRAAVVFYEAPRRLGKILDLLHNVVPTARLVIGRELTKIHEEIVLLDIAEAKNWARDHQNLKGEAVVMVAPMRQVENAEDRDEFIRSAISKAFRQGQTLRDILRDFKDAGLSRSDLYRLALEIKENLGE